MDFVAVKELLLFIIFICKVFCTAIPEAWGFVPILMVSRNERFAVLLFRQKL